MAIAMLFSCEKVYLGEEDNNNSKTIAFNLMAPGTTRATSVADFQTILVLDIMDGKAQQLIRQARGAADFGAPTITLAPGAHTLRFMATDCENERITVSDDYTDIYKKPLGDTFYRSIDIDTREASDAQTVVLERNIALICYQAEESSVIYGRLYLFTGYPVYDDPSESTMTKDTSFYTYIPQDGLLSLDNGNTVPVAANHRTVIYDRDGTTDYEPNPNDDDEIKVLENDTVISPHQPTLLRSLPA